MRLECDGMIISKMKITNSRGESITFGTHFKLMDDFELSGKKASVNYSDSTLDGSHYQNTRLENQDYRIPFFIDRKNRPQFWIEEHRSEVLRILNPKSNPHRIDFTTKAGVEYYLNANLEESPTFGTGFDNDNPLWLKGFLSYSSGDPYFYENKVDVIDVALWIGNFTFPLEIVEDGIEMGYRTNSYIANVVNRGHVPNGMTIIFRANGLVRNPSLLDTRTYELFKLDIEMIAGDIIEVSTHKGNKKITLNRNNEITNIFGKRQMRSKFLQLEVGDNILRYDADFGVDRLDIQIKTTPRLMGV